MRLLERMRMLGRERERGASINLRHSASNRINEGAHVLAWSFVQGSRERGENKKRKERRRRELTTTRSTDESEIIKLGHLIFHDSR